MILSATRRDFVSLQDRCRAVIAKRVRSQHQLVHLHLPPIITKYIAEAIPMTHSSSHGNSISSVDSRFRIVKHIWVCDIIYPSSFAVYDRSTNVYILGLLCLIWIN